MLREGKKKIKWDRHEAFNQERSFIQIGAQRKPPAKWEKQRETRQIERIKRRNP